MVTYMEIQTVPRYMSVTFTRWTLRITNFTRAPHAQPSLSNFPKWDSNFGEPTHSRRMTNSDKIFQLPPKIKTQTQTLFDLHVNSNNIFPTGKMNIVLTLVGLPQRMQPLAVGGILQPPNRTATRTYWKPFVRTFCTQLLPNKITITVI